MSDGETGEVRESRVLSDLPVDELILYGRELGLTLDLGMGQGELLRRVRERRDLLDELEHDALLDIVVWARRPVRQSASKEELAKEIASIMKMDMNGLTPRGLAALARLRGVEARESEPRVVIEARIRSAESIWDRLRRKRRRWVGSFISKMLIGPEDSETQEYRFLPEDGQPTTLRKDIEDDGVVGGIARRIRGAADTYVHEKLNEIEARIDHKLDEIDRRLAEWRDREIANRLKIIKITLIASVLVALLSYGYSCLKTHG